IAEHEGQAVFLHRVVSGASDNSYGVQVARMAGLPGAVTARAADILLHGDDQTRLRLAASQTQYTAQTRDDHTHAVTLHQGAPTETTARAEAHQALALALASLNIASMTPIEAINVLFSLQQRALQAIHEPAAEGALRP